MNVGRITYSPDYVRLPKQRHPEPGLGSVKCCGCDTELLCISGGPPKSWKWSSDGWLCGTCAVSSAPTEDQP